MSAYEKIASVIILVLAAALLFSWSTHEHREAPHDDAQVNFDDSYGQGFAIGPFDLVVGSQSSYAGREGCGHLEPVFVAALHDIYLRIKEAGPGLGIEGDWNAFQVNDDTLSLLCRPDARITLYDDARDTLLIRTRPSERAVPAGGLPEDVGSTVTMEAYVARAGSPLPDSPQAATRVLIPDRYLIDASTSPATR